MTTTPKPQTGMWILTAPNGKQWQADSPLKVCGAEQRERVPARVGLSRIFAATAQPEQQTERNFCTRCGKRLAGDGIHTCTPPKATT